MPWITAVFALRDSFIESLAPAVPHTCAASSAFGLSRRAADACVNVENFAQMFSHIHGNVPHSRYLSISIFSTCDLVNGQRVLAKFQKAFTL